MSIEETRQLGIEFERRVQTMIPEKEFDKLDTETIYSFLNQYQDKLLHDLYKSLGAIAQQPRPNEYIESILQSMLSYDAISLTELSESGNGTEYTATLPTDFGMYSNSTTTVDRTYSMKNITREEGPSGVVPNVLVSQTVANQFVQQPQDNMRIMRNPIVYLDTANQIHLVCDTYTEPKILGLYYYKIPRYMDLMTSQPCELPMEAFEDLVSGAIDLYVQHVAGAEVRKKQLIEQAKQQARKEADQ